MASTYQYRVGGHLPIDAPSYVVRAADRQFYAGLKAGELCYVLNSRQMGKSSLRFRTMNLLQQAGMACVAIDLQGIGSHNITPQQWYAGLVKRLIQGLQLTTQIDLRSWWQEREVISPVQRFSEFIEVVLPQFIEQPITIFIDEIDSTLSLEFDTDDFFAAIRACSELPQINFALLGVATPSDLIKDGRRSPFNVGQAIDLRGFQPEETQPLLDGLQDQAMRPEIVLAAILDWTGGQPFLTQKLCKLIQELDTPLSSHYESEFVASLVRSKIITHWETQDEPEHLKTIRNYLVRGGQPQTYHTLSLYQNMLKHGSIPVDQSLSQTELRLSGIAVKRNDRLEISNSIYANIFDQVWLDRVLGECLPSGATLVQHQKLRRNVALGASTLAALSAAVIAVNGWKQSPQTRQRPPASALEASLVSKSLPTATHSGDLSPSQPPSVSPQPRVMQSPTISPAISPTPKSQSIPADLPSLDRSPVPPPVTTGKLPTPQAIPVSPPAFQESLPSISIPAVSPSPEPSFLKPIQPSSPSLVGVIPHPKQVRLLLNSSKLRRQTLDYSGSLLDAIKAVQELQQIQRLKPQMQLQTPVLRNLQTSLRQIRRSTGNGVNNLELQSQDLATLVEKGCQELRDYSATHTNLGTEVNQVCGSN